MAENYAESGNHKKAYQYQRLHIELKDSLTKQQNSKQIAGIEANYENEKKSAEIKLLEKEAELQEAKLAKQEAEVKRQGIQRNALVAGFLMLFVLVLVIYRGYRQKMKYYGIIEQNNKDITDSIRYAKKIQDAILPKEQELIKAFPDHFVYYMPKAIVSGDFYWFAGKNGRSHIAACDCTGHGVPGAFVSFIGNDLLNQIINEQGVENPGKILTLLNRGMKNVFTREGAEQQAQDGMDAAFCCLNTAANGNVSGIARKQILEFAGANNPLILIQNGKLKQIRGDKTPIGGETAENYNFTNHRIEVHKGDTFYLFSDGYQDQFGGTKNKKFMIKRLMELLLSVYTKPMREQKEILSQTIDQWKGEHEQVDDICIIGVRI